MLFFFYLINAHLTDGRDIRYIRLIRHAARHNKIDKKKWPLVTDVLFSLGGQLSEVFLMQIGRKEEKEEETKWKLVWEQFAVYWLDSDTWAATDVNVSSLHGIITRVTLVNVTQNNRRRVTCIFYHEYNFYALLLKEKPCRWHKHSNISVKIKTLRLRGKWIFGSICSLSQCWLSIWSPIPQIPLVVSL